MKKSSIAVLSALSLIVLVMIVMLIFTRVLIGSNRSSRSSGSVMVSESLDMESFTGITVEGYWKVRIKHGEDFRTEIEYPENLKDFVRVNVRGHNLVLGYTDNDCNDCDDLTATITMPVLRELHIEGAADVELSGFDEDRMDVIIDGAGRVQAWDSSAQELRVHLNGLASVNLEGLSAVNARVDLEGAGEVRVRMDGGFLDGSIDGLGSIKYSGEVREQRIDVSGLGSVKHVG